MFASLILKYVLFQYLTLQRLLNSLTKLYVKPGNSQGKVFEPFWMKNYNF